MKLLGKKKLNAVDLLFMSLITILTVISVMALLLGSANVDNEMKLFSFFLLVIVISMYQTRLLFNKKYLRIEAQRRESALDYDAAIEIWETLDNIEEAARVRKLQLGHSEQSALKVEIKESIPNRSNDGGGSSKAKEIKEIKELLDSGAIDDDEFKQMKKEILEK